jgi:hypothetical protein
MKFDINVIKMKQWPYYTNVYYKYTHGSFNINNEIYYLKNYITFFLNQNDKAQKSNLIPKIKCTILLEQLYYIYYNIRLENAQKGITVVCFHPHGCLIKQIPWRQP